MPRNKKKRLDKVKYLTDTQIQKQSNKIAVLHKDIEDAVGRAISSKILLGKGTRLQLEREIKQIIRDHDLHLDEFGTKELEMLQDDRLKEFESHNIKRKKNVDRSENTLPYEKLEKELQKKISTLPKKSLKLYNGMFKEFKKEEAKSLNILKVDKTLSKKELQELAKEIGYESVKDLFVNKGDDILYYVSKSGKRERAEYWYNRNMRMAMSDVSTNELFSDMEDFEHYHLRTSAHNDASKLCVDYQGKPYSMKKNDKFPYYPDICMFTSTIGGTYKHWNCRHNESIYFEGESVDNIYDDVLSMSDDEINELYERRQKGNYYKRNALIWKDKRDRARAMGANAKELRYYRAKITHYNNLALSMGVNL